MSGCPPRCSPTALVADPSQSGAEPIAPARVARAAPAALVPAAALVAAKTRQRMCVAVPASGSQSGSVLARTERRMTQTGATGIACSGRRPGGCTSDSHRHSNYAGQSASHDGLLPLHRKRARSPPGYASAVPALQSPMAPDWADEFVSASCRHHTASCHCGRASNLPVTCSNADAHDAPHRRIASAPTT